MDACVWVPVGTHRSSQSTHYGVRCGPAGGGGGSGLADTSGVRGASETGDCCERRSRITKAAECGQILVSASGAPAAGRTSPGDEKVQRHEY